MKITLYNIDFSCQTSNFNAKSSVKKERITDLKEREPGYIQTKPKFTTKFERSKVNKNQNNLL